MNADDMYSEVLAEEVRYLKETEGGRSHMCRVLEEMREEAVEATKRETAFELADMGLPVEKIAKAVKVSLETVQKWLSGNVSVAK